MKNSEILQITDYKYKLDYFSFNFCQTGSKKSRPDDSSFSHFSKVQRIHNYLTYDFKTSNDLSEL